MKLLLLLYYLKSSKNSRNRTEEIETIKRKREDLALGKHDKLFKDIKFTNKWSPKYNNGTSSWSCYPVVKKQNDRLQEQLQLQGGRSICLLEQTFGELFI